MMGMRSLQMDAAAPAAFPEWPRTESQELAIVPEAWASPSIPSGGMA
jgi:hypothetical protein